MGHALKGDGNGISLALDPAGSGAGFLAGGLVTGFAWTAIFAFVKQVGITAASSGVSIAYESGPGIVADIAGEQIGLTAKTAETLGGRAVEAFGKSIPGVGASVSAGAAICDLKGIVAKIE